MIIKNTISEEILAAGKILPLKKIIFFQLRLSKQLK
jgi:hypothetical protein